MICHVWDRVAAASTVDEAVIATEDERVGEACDQHGLAWIMTSDGHETGTDRVAEVATMRTRSTPLRRAAIV